MKKVWIYLVGCIVPVLLGCDLHPKIMSLPDSVGDFISERYPALLADPYAQPEIYNSAASDYGVYASPELYGSVTADEYVLYSSVNDYIIPPQSDDVTPENVSNDVTGNRSSENETVADTDTIADTPTDDYLIVPMYGTLHTETSDNTPSEITVAAGDTLYSLARRHNTTVSDLAQINNLKSPYILRAGQVLKIKGTTSEPAPVVAQPDATVTAAKADMPKPVIIDEPKPTTTKVELQEITVAQGDTLYSISRKYSVPVNDLAVMNDIGAPFALRVGQHLKVPNLDAPSVRVATKVDVPTASAPTKTSAVIIQPQKKATIPVAQNNTKSNTSAKQATTKKSVENKTQKTQTPTNTKQADNVKQPAKTTQKTKAVQKSPTIAARSSSKFSWPVRGRILSGFGSKSNGLFNDGINISATRGTAVSAAENGVVAYAGNEVKGMGNLVIIQHSDGWMTVYAHMDSMSVRRGAKVSVGQKIGTVGTSGKVDKPQLHFEIRKGTKAYNPTQYLKK